MNKKQILEAAFITKVANEGELAKPTFKLTDVEVDRWWYMIGTGHYRLGVLYNDDGTCSPALYDNQR